MAQTGGTKRAKVLVEPQRALGVLSRRASLTRHRWSVTLVSGQRRVGVGDGSTAPAGRRVRRPGGDHRPAGGTDRAPRGRRQEVPYGAHDNRVERAWTALKSLIANTAIPGLADAGRSTRSSAPAGPANCRPPSSETTLDRHQVACRTPGTPPSTGCLARSRLSLLVAEQLFRRRTSMFSASSTRSQPNSS